MRVIVCGKRDYTNRDFVYKWLGALFNPVYPNDMDGLAGTWLPRPDLVLIVGRAKGVDSIAEDWAIVNWVQYEWYEADWEKYGKAAGYLRNKRMLEEGKPDLVVAFPGGKGTANMVEIARQAGVAVVEIYDNKKE